MAKTAVEPMFVDANILVYSAVRAAPLNRSTLRALHDLRAAGAELWVSRQVLREFLAALSRPQSFTGPVPIADLEAAVAGFLIGFHIAEDGPLVTANLLALLRSTPCGGKQVHDANFVATMQAHGLRRLLTHNVGDFARFGGIVDVVPL